MFFLGYSLGYLTHACISYFARLRGGAWEAVSLFAYLVSNAFCQRSRNIPVFGFWYWFFGTLIMIRILSGGGGKARLLFFVSWLG